MTTAPLAPAARTAGLGPRRPGTVYRNADGVFRVLAVVTDPAIAREVLRRDSARFAVWLLDLTRPGAEPFAVGSVWTDSDFIETDPQGDPT